MRLLLLLSILTLALAACDVAGDPGEIVEQYLSAKVAGDADQMAQLLCSAMEARLEEEARTFETVSEVRIEGLDCAQTGDNTVTCDGVIVATYGLQDTEFPLVSYRVVQEDGEWRWCGETE